MEKRKKIMNKNYFEIMRCGVHTTFQDNGYSNIQHLGITTGGIVDNELFRLANKIVNNESISIFGNTSEASTSIKWTIERVV